MVELKICKIQFKIECDSSNSRMLRNGARLKRADITLTSPKKVLLSDQNMLPITKRRRFDNAGVMGIVLHHLNIFELKVIPIVTVGLYGLIVLCWVTGAPDAMVCFGVF